MGIDKIFQALNEYVKLKKTHESGDQYSFPLVQVKREVEGALVELIDSRIKAYMGRERRRSGAATVKSMDAPGFEPTVVQTVMPNFEPTKLDVPMLDALNSAPTPPSNPARWLAEGDPMTWIENYYRWYYIKRTAAINGRDTKDDE